MGNEVDLMLAAFVLYALGFMFPSPMGNEVDLIVTNNFSPLGLVPFPSPMGNEVGLIETGSIGIFSADKKFPSPIGNEVGLIKEIKKMQKDFFEVSVPYGE